MTKTTCLFFFSVFMMVFAKPALTAQGKKCDKPLYPLKACNFIRYIEHNPSVFQAEATFTCEEFYSGTSVPVPKTVSFFHENPTVVQHLEYVVHDEGNNIVMNRIGRITNTTMINRCTREVTFLDTTDGANRLEHVCTLSTKMLPPESARKTDPFWAPCDSDDKQPKCRKGDSECEELLKHWKKTH